MKWRLLDWSQINSISTNARVTAVSGVLFLYGYVPAPLRSFVFRFFLSISPNVPTALARGVSGRSGFPVLVWAFFSAVVLCYGATAILTYLNHTWSGSDPERVYFSTDLLHRWLYLLIAPSYVAFLCSLISVFIQKHATIAALVEEFSGVKSLYNHFRFPLVLLLIPILSCTFTYTYINDILSTPATTPIYWFLSTYHHGEMHLNNVGVYYVILNFMLLTIVVTEIFCFFSLFLRYLM